MCNAKPACATCTSTARDLPLRKRCASRVEVRHLVCDLPSCFCSAQSEDASEAARAAVEAPISATASLGFAHAQGFEQSAGVKADFMMRGDMPNPSSSAAAVKGDSPSSLSARDTERAGGGSSADAIESHTLLSAAPAPRRLNLMTGGGLGKREADSAGGRGRSMTQTPRDDGEMSSRATSVSKHPAASSSKGLPSAPTDTAGPLANGVFDVNALISEGSALTLNPEPVP